jgi:hypothetical protein
MVAECSDKILRWQHSLTEVCCGQSQTKIYPWQHSVGNVAGAKLYAKQCVAMALTRKPTQWHCLQISLSR